ncbi:mechanosensitive ion channel family protein [Variovorax ginsengisoli]|jgi:small-conductance mechanosensitive channel|uniref:Small-conductance mechanosensitive channel n=1 Tax=Variovorax ginsengisoli TaxID=363844 RepID=A0ABT8RWW3_9BURK|nr:mechanosensitive ion channel family protein [Variovorax ginsengisoli]MDN8611959.1 mechanosensitive ion channel family protein [Variovorax ginsengisoli]MDO1531129.1 mechanosensitive ion channel family protein [Variovorax ginsengisoli]
MNRTLQGLRAQLPPWAIEWLEVIVPLAQVALILLGAWLLVRVARRLIERVTTGYALPGNVDLVTRRTVAFLIYGGALLWGLERLGVSGTVLWTAFTSFAAVGAVAFFAAWSVLSNIFCALLIFTTRMFWPGDTIEVLENGEKPGLKGRVLDINLVFTTLEESGSAQGGTTLKIPNSMFFQRAVRRWHGSAPALPRTLDLTPRPSTEAPPG